MQFRNCSLKNLPEDMFKSFSKKLCRKQLEALKQKGIYSYEHMNSFERFDITKLARKKDLYRSLKDKHIRLLLEDHEHAMKFRN